jgi:uncharacterized membrane protein (UPF0127 family)
MFAGSTRLSSPRLLLIWRRGAAPILAFIAAAVLLALFSTLHRMRQDPVVFTDVITPSRFRLRLVLAETPTKRSRGLSDVASLTNDGLLLLWPEPGQHPIWMDGMKFPLDLLWCDASGRILAIERNVPPCFSQSPCPLYGLPIPNARLVVELAADRAAGLHLRVGETLDVRALGVAQQLGSSYPNG